MIEASQKSDEGKQILANKIIDFCNCHARESMKLYELTHIGYARLVIFSNGNIMYFERLLIGPEHPNIFDPTYYVWKWSTPKKTKGKEQLPAFVGLHKATGTKHFAWHGLGENQLHFSGEDAWWPPEGDIHRVDFNKPDDRHKVSFETIAEWLAQLPLVEAVVEAESNRTPAKL